MEKCLQIFENKGEEIEIKKNTRKGMILSQLKFIRGDQSFYSFITLYYTD